MRDRRGRTVRGSSGLLEREHPLRAIAEVLDAAQLGSGRGLLIEGHAGLGKTRLHEASLDRARSLDFRVLRAAGSELERNVSFGVAAQLLSSLLAGLPEIRRRVALDSAPERIRRLAGHGVDIGAGGAPDEHSLVHALFAMIGEASKSQPLLITIDDLHWADEASLEFIAYALQRITERQMAIVMTSRPSAGQDAFAALDRIAAHLRVRVERLAPLGEDAVLTLARRRPYLAGPSRSTRRRRGGARPCGGRPRRRRAPTPCRRASQPRDRGRGGRGRPARGGRGAARAGADAWAGSPAEVVGKLAERSWDDGRLLEHETGDGIGWTLLVAAHRLVANFERALELIEAVERDAERRALPLALATAYYLRGLPLLGQGNVSAAIVALELAMDARSEGWRQFTRSAVASYCLALIETGEPEQAEDALLSGRTPAGSVDLDLAPNLAHGALTPPRALDTAPASPPCAEARQPEDLEDVLWLYARAELRLVQNRPQEALDDALAARDAIGPVPWLVDDRPWRTVAAQAALALGDREQALEFARTDLENAERTGVLHSRIRALRVLGVAEGGDAGLESLRAAVEFGRRGPERLETIRALVELGAALRRANRRTRAREPLQTAADLARRGGARALHERARIELAASGARPRRALLLSGPESLTPSERRVAELAAAGRTNREISQTLFVTPKTVEFHLRNVYRKLEIETRRDLARALAA